MNPQYRKALVLVVLLLFLGMFLVWWTDRNPALAQYPGVTVQFASAQFTVAENAVTATITVTLSQSSADEVKVDFTISDGTAKEPDDYSSASGTLTFPPGKTSQTFQVTINDDLLGEADETVTLTLSNPVKADLVHARNRHPDNRRRRWRAAHGGVFPERIPVRGKRRDGGGNGEAQCPGC